MVVLKVFGFARPVENRLLCRMARWVTKCRSRCRPWDTQIPSYFGIISCKTPGFGVKACDCGSKPTSSASCRVHKTLLFAVFSFLVKSQNRRYLVWQMSFDPPIIVSLNQAFARCLYPEGSRECREVHRRLKSGA